MKTVYQQHQAAFKRVSAYAIVCATTHAQIGAVSFKYPQDGAGRLYCYLHIFGTQMVRAHVAGYGYDKQTASFMNAVNKLELLPDSTDLNQIICNAFRTQQNLVQEHTEFRHRMFMFNDKINFTFYRVV